jgi:hypothetical protein
MDFYTTPENKVFVKDYDAFNSDQMKKINNFNGLLPLERKESIENLIKELKKC